MVLPPLVLLLWVSVSGWVLVLVDREGPMAGVSWCGRRLEGARTGRGQIIGGCCSMVWLFWFECGGGGRSEVRELPGGRLSWRT